MQVQLFKKNGTYTDKEGKEKRYTNFYLKCGDALVPIEICFFPQEKFDGRDPQYSGRKEVLSAFAAILPDKTDNGNSSQEPQNATPTGSNASASQSQPASDSGLPF